MPATGSVGVTGNAIVDGVLSGGKWAVSTLTFSFPTSASFYGSGYGSGEPGNGFEAFNAAQQVAVREVLQQYSAVANLTFTEIAETGTQHADLRFAESNAPGTAWAYYPTTRAEGGDAWFNHTNYNSPTKGSYAYTAILHEMGHALGLKHAHETSGAFVAIPAGNDSMEFTVMSYRSYVGGSTTTGYTNETWGYAQSLMQADIAGLQKMYGANFGANSGDTVYSWSSATGAMSINGAAQVAPGGNKIFQTIWDGGGADTYDFSNYATNLTIDLQPGAWTTVSAAQLAKLHYNGTQGARGNIANALLYNNDQRSLIENANGGSGNDAMVGNAAANILKGNGGNDSLTGGGGNDTIHGGTGGDILTGGAGDDLFVFAPGGQADTITDFLSDDGDRIDFRAFAGVADLAGLPAVFTQVGGDAIINFGFGDALTLLNVDKLTLTDESFIFDRIPDTTPPSAPVISRVNDDVLPGTGYVANGGTTNDPTPTVRVSLTGTGAEAGDHVQLFDGSTALGSAVNLTAAYIGTGYVDITTPVLTNGTHSFTAKLTDASGNSGLASTLYTITTAVAPVISRVNDDVLPGTGYVANGGTTNDPTPTVRVSLTGTGAEAGDHVQLFDGSTALGSAVNLTAAHLGTGYVDITTPVLTNGTHSFSAKLTDASGNSGLASTLYTITTAVAPVISRVNDDVLPGTGYVANGGTTNDPTPTVRVSLTGTGAEAGDHVQLFDGSTALGSAVNLTAAYIGTGYVDITTPVLTNGTHSFTAKLTDASGNSGLASTLYTITTAVAPVISRVNDDVLPGTGYVANGGTTNDPTPTVRVSLTGTGAEAGDHVQLFDGSTALGSAVNLTAAHLGTGYVDITTPVLTNGTHSFTAKLTDASGNSGLASAAYGIILDALPSNSNAALVWQSSLREEHGSLLFAHQQGNDPALDNKRSLNSHSERPGDILFDNVNGISEESIALSSFSNHFDLF